MPKLTLSKSFQKDLDGLRRSSRKHYQRTCELLFELQRDQAPSAHRRSESRIPECIKYELPDGYRLVLQKAENASALIALVVGKHDHVESYLDGHKGYVFDAKSGRVRALSLATSDKTSIDITPSAAVQSRVDPTPSDAPVFGPLSPEMLARIGVPKDLVGSLLNITDANGLECMKVLQEIADHEERAADNLLSFATGNSETRQAVLDAANGNATVLEQFPAAAIESPSASSEEFVTFSDPEDLFHVLRYGTLQQWQLFLHPDQSQLVNRSLSGPARLRGISGSGKTVVALHRARRLAIKARRTGQRILFTTFNKGLASAAGVLLRSLCGAELTSIEVTHVHRWCLDYIYFRTGKNPRFSPGSTTLARERVLSEMSPQTQQVLASIKPDYLWDEIAFLMGRFLHEETDNYLTTDRTGRGRPITSEQRKEILGLYQKYYRRLSEQGIVEPAEFVRMAYKLRLKNEPPRHDYAAVIVDEMQDLSEIELRLLHSLVGDRQDGLLLVGDMTQRVYTRGYSLRGLGIDIAGRGIVLRKNYRNTRQILEAAFPLVRAEWEEDIAQTGGVVSEANPEFSVREGMKPIVVSCRDEAAEGRFLTSEIVALLNFDHYRPSDICIVARNRRFRTLAMNSLKDANIPVYDFQDPDVRDISFNGGNAVRVSTLHGAKGHEFGTVFLVGVVDGVMPQASARDRESLASEAALLYVAMTRARDLVYLSYSETSRAGFWSRRSRFIDRIADMVDEVSFQW